MKEKFNRYFYFLFINIFAFTNSVLAVDQNTGTSGTYNNEELLQVNADCNSIPAEIIQKLDFLWNYIIIIGPIIFIVSGLLDLLKAVSATEEKAFSLALRKIFKKFIALIILFILPLLINFVLGLLNPNLGVCI